jgi:DNA-binding HxlR family transcriptional regulator
MINKIIKTIRFASTREIDYVVIRALKGERKRALDLMDATGLNLATIYCSLHRLEKREIVASEFDNNSANENRFSARTKYYYLKF